MNRLLLSLLKPIACVLLLGLGSIAIASDQSLVQAARKGKHDAAMALIRQEADVNQRSADGTTALHWAVYNGDVELSKRLIRAGADVSVENLFGSTPMSEASRVGNAQLLSELIRGGADVNSPNPEGQTALMAVARTGKLDAAQLLIKAGADVNAFEAWGGQTALMWAASRKHPEMLKLLIKNGAELDARGARRDWERRVTSEARVKELHTGGFTALLYAVRENCLECVKILIEAGADINKPDPDNVSALVLALLNLRFDVAKYLVEAGAAVDQWDIWGETAIYAAADTNMVPTSMRGDRPAYGETSGLVVARMLLERGANPNLQLKIAPLPREIGFDRRKDYQALNAGTTPLARAAYGGDVDYMRLLIEFGARVDLQNVHGIGPVLSMIDKGGSRGLKKTEAQILDGLQVLLEAGADMSERNLRGETPLHLAVRSNKASVVNFLVNQGVDLDVKTEMGLTIMDYASGAADVAILGNNDTVGVLPEMIALINELTQD